MNKEAYLRVRNSIDLEKKWTPLLTFFAGDIALFSAILFLLRSPWKSLSIPLIPILMFRNFALMHDGSHRAICKNSWLNRWLGFWCGCVALLPFKAWTESHIKHHIWSGNIEMDPVMALRVTVPQAPEKMKSFLSLAWRMWFPLIAALQFTLFWKLSLTYAYRTKSWSLFIETLAPLLLWSALLLGLPASISVAVLLPALFLYFLINEVINLPHHLQLPVLQGSAKLPFWEQYKTARSCLYPTWVARYVTLNFNLHSEHHMYPDAPWYTLDKISAALKEDLKDLQFTDVMLDWSLMNRQKNFIEVITKDATEIPQAS